MSEKQILNARIRKVSLGIEDHGILTSFIFLDFGGTQQGFGGYNIKQTAGIWIRRCMEIAGVSEWEDLVGKNIRAIKNDYSSPIEAIGNIIEDKWFNPSEEFKNL